LAKHIQVREKKDCIKSRIIETDPIKERIRIISGKTTLAVNLTLVLVVFGTDVGLLDADITGRRN
jgi:polynucleotide 5'-kinase involved in rRNA processing